VCERQEMSPTVEASRMRTSSLAGRHVRALPTLPYELRLCRHVRGATACRVHRGTSSTAMAIKPETTPSMLLKRSIAVSATPEHADTITKCFQQWSWWVARAKVDCFGGVSSRLSVGSRRTCLGSNENLPLSFSKIATGHDNAEKATRASMLPSRSI